MKYIECLNKQINNVDGLFLNGDCQTKSYLEFYYKRIFINRAIYLCMNCYKNNIYDDAINNTFKYIMLNFNNNSKIVDHFLKSDAKYKEPFYETNHYGEYKPKNNKWHRKPKNNKWYHKLCLNF
jgi:hypothetical protein